MAVAADKILSTLEDERTAAQRGLPFKVLSSRRQGNLVILAVEPMREGHSSAALDESLEGSRAVWYGKTSGRGEVVVVDPDKGEFTLRRPPLAVSGRDQLSFQRKSSPAPEAPPENRIAPNAKQRLGPFWATISPVNSSL